MAAVYIRIHLIYIRKYRQTNKYDKRKLVSMQRFSAHLSGGEGVGVVGVM